MHPLTCSDLVFWGFIGCITGVGRSVDEYIIGGAPNMGTANGYNMLGKYWTVNTDTHIRINYMHTQYIHRIVINYMH